MSGFSRSHGLQLVVIHIFIQYQISLVGRAVRALGAKGAHGTPSLLFVISTGITLSRRHLCITTSGHRGNESSGARAPKL